MGAESVVRSLARRGLEVVGQLPPSGSSRAVASSSAGNAPSSSGSAWGSGGAAAASAPLMGTPFEPYANPTHPSARPDTTPGILAGNPLEEYANPSPQWQQAASAAAAALAQADAQLPPSVAASSWGAAPAASGGGSGRTAAAVAGASGQTSGLGPSARVQPLLQRLQAFMEQHVYPAGGSPSQHVDCVECRKESHSRAGNQVACLHFIGEHACCPQCTVAPLQCPFQSPLLPNVCVCRGYAECACAVGCALDHPPAAGKQAGHATAGQPPSKAGRQCLPPKGIHTTTALLLHAQERLKDEAKRQGLWNLWIPAGGSQFRFACWGRGVVIQAPMCALCLWLRAWHMAVKPVDPRRCLPVLLWFADSMCCVLLWDCRRAASVLC